MGGSLHWFDRYRGMAVAIAPAATIVGGTIWPPLVNFGIEQCGWRTTISAVGISRRWR